MESIARRVLDAYDERLYRGQPRAIPIEDLIERHGLILEFQYLRKNGRILGKTVFDTGLEAVYDMELGEYILFPVKAGTILIDASLCEEETSTGRLRFTEAHELSHWILHKGLYPARPCGSGSPTTICCKIFYCGVLKIENTLEGGTPCNK